MSTLVAHWCANEANAAAVLHHFRARVAAAILQNVVNVPSAAALRRWQHMCPEMMKRTRDEVKLVRCLAGRIFDVIPDLRPNSPTYLKWQGFELSRQNRRQISVPKGCAHGFQSFIDDAETSYMISARYGPGAAAGYRFDDPAFRIDWPLPPTLLSERDRSWPDVVAQTAARVHAPPLRAVENA